MGIRGLSGPRFGFFKPRAVQTLAPPALLGPAFVLLQNFLGDTVNQNFNTFNFGGPATSWAIIGGALPTGLTLNTSTGFVTGTCTALGTFNFTIEACNSGGCDSETYGWDVN